MFVGVGVLVWCVWRGCWFGPPCVGPLEPETLRRTTQNFALFFPLPPPFRSFCLSLCVFSLNFGGVFELRDPKTCTIEGSGASNTTHTPREDSRREKKRDEKTSRERKKSENGAGDGKKSVKFWAPPPFGPDFFWAPLSGAHHDTHQIQKWIGQNWIGQSRSLPTQTVVPRR